MQHDTERRRAQATPMATESSERGETEHSETRARISRPPDELTPTVRVALDMAWALSLDVAPRERPAARFSTGALLLAICDLAKTDAYPGSETLGMLREVLRDRGTELARARALYLTGERFQEPPVCETSSMSEAALRTVRLARLLAEEPASPQVRMRHMLGALLLTPALPRPTAAHEVLQFVGLRVDALRERCP
jgi:hypothetical protein